LGSEAGKDLKPWKEQSTTVVSMSGRLNELLMHVHPVGQLLAASAPSGTRNPASSALANTRRGADLPIGEKWDEVALSRQTGPRGARGKREWVF